MTVKAVVISGFVAVLAASSVFAQSTAPERVRARSAAKRPAAEPVRVLTKKEKSEAEEAYRQSLEVVSRAREIGDEGQAFLLYTDALLKLRKIHGQYPAFKAKEVDAKIKEVNSLLASLEDAKCQNLEDEKAGRFRFLVWKRQIMMLDRIDKLQATAESNTEMLEEIKDKLGI